MDAPTPSPMPLRLVWALAACAALAAGCSDTANPLAPYEGHRPLEILKATQSFTPEIQWVGGRVAAVGVNRGTRAALDSTLVWLRTADDGNTISSFATVGQATAQALIESYGGTPRDSLSDGETYTFWIAEAAAFQAGLDSTRFEPSAFADTTLTMRLILSRGIRGGVAQFEVTRDERLTGEEFVLQWTPETVRFRRIAIRKATSGGFQDLIWFVDVPDDHPDGIAQPLVIGDVPPGGRETTPFAGFEGPREGEPAVYTIWGATSAWTGGFTAATPGYAFIQIRRDNFGN